MWYYAQNNAPVGPITCDDLAGRIRTGVVTPDTLVFTSGMPQWQAAKDTPQLAALFAGSAPPAAPPPSIGRRAHDLTYRIVDDTSGSVITGAYRR